MESKYSKSGYSGTKRRRFEYSSAGSSNKTVVNRRIAKLYKMVKARVPVHLYQSNIATEITTVSTTGSSYDLSSHLAQGDDYNNRIGGSCIIRRLIVRATLVPGSAATSSTTVRVSVLRQPSGTAFAANMTSSYSPVVDGTVTQCLFDKYLEVGGAPGTVGFPTNIYINRRINHKQKFSSNAAGSQLGESIYLIVQSNVAAGTGAPTFGAGCIEVFFDPT